MHTLEAQYQKACTWLQAPEGKKANGKPNYSGACKRDEFSGITYHTLRNRYLGKHKAAHEAHASQMRLLPEEETSLVEWAVKAAREGQPWSRTKLKGRAVAVVRSRETSDGGDTNVSLPPDQWVRRFNRRHAELLHLRKTTGLDPKRVQCFNPTIVGDHFEKWGVLFGKYHIHVNVDEIGNQSGGGRKGTGEKAYTEAGSPL